MTSPARSSETLSVSLVMKPACSANFHRFSPMFSASSLSYLPVGTYRKGVMPKPD